MAKRIRRKIKNKSGVTLAETLIAIVILLMVVAIVAAGIPVAVNAYDEIVTSANAQVLLSTTMTRLRDELCTAADIKAEGGTITYVSSAGSKSVIYLGDGGICLREYADITDSPEYDRLLVTREAANNNLRTSFASCEYSGGVIKFTDLAVKKGDETMIGAAAFEIKILTDIKR